MSDAERLDRALDRFPHYPPGSSPHGVDEGCGPPRQLADDGEERQPTATHRAGSVRDGVDHEGS